MAETTYAECPDCGHDGPHTVVDRGEDSATVECGSCYIEFSVDDLDDLLD